MNDEVHEDRVMCYSGEKTNAAVAVRSRNHSSEHALTKS